MRLKDLTFEHLMIALFFSAGVGIRLINLGHAPLSDYEANNALQALAIKNGADPGTITSPAYVLLTGLLFSLFDDSNYLARFIPAVAGCVLLLSVVMLRNLLGRKATLVLLLGLALDPGLTAISRLAGGQMISLGLGVLFLAGIYLQRPVLTGVSGALALMSGPGIYGGFLGIALTAGIGFYLYQSNRINRFWDDGSNQADKSFWGAVFRTGALTLILAGTFFLSRPFGLSATLNGLPLYLSGWLKNAGLPAGRLISALLIYQPLPIILAILAIYYGWKERIPILQWLSIWVVVALVISLLYPSRQTYDLVWPLLPIWSLAATGLMHFLGFRDIELLPALSQSTLIVLLASLSWINMAGLSVFQTNLQTYQLRWALIIGTLFLGVVTTILVGFGWTFKTARHGLMWGLICSLGLYSVSNLWGTAQLRGNGENELWQPGPVIRQSAELMETLSELSQWRTGIENSLDVSVLSSASSLKWLLREWPEARFLSAIPSGELPSAIITTSDQGPKSLPIGYRGQDFSWWISADWSGGLPPNWPEWLVFRIAPQRIEKIILWVRADLFPGGVLLGEEGSTPQEDELLPPDLPSWWVH